MISLTINCLLKKYHKCNTNEMITIFRVMTDQQFDEFYAGLVGWTKSEEDEDEDD